MDGGEIGRAQAVQAQACGLEPQVDFNPVLLKPNSDTGAQVIVHGHAVANMDARHYHDYKRLAFDAVMASHTRLVRPTMRSLWKVREVLPKSICAIATLRTWDMPKRWIVR